MTPLETEMNKTITLSQHSLNFYKYWRENYRWPIDNTRKKSEESIAELLKETRDSLSNLPSSEKLLLQKIHYWKTQNRGGTTDKYVRILEKDTQIIPNLQKLFSVWKTMSLDFIKELIEVLRVEYANLPVCSAQVSFLCNRAVPILDRFVAQFFSWTVSPEILSSIQFNMHEVLRDITPISFVIEDDGTYRCIPRLAVYHNTQNYVRNRDLFVFELIPELNHIAKTLNNQEVTYQDIYGKSKEFTNVDVEMAVFAFGTQNRRYFQCWYEGQPAHLDLR